MPGKRSVEMFILHSQKPMELQECIGAKDSPALSTIAPTEDSRSSEDEWDEPLFGSASPLWSSEASRHELDVKSVSALWGSEALTSASSSLGETFSPFNGETSIWGATTLIGGVLPLDSGFSARQSPSAAAEATGDMFTQGLIEHLTNGVVDLDEVEGRTRGHHILSMLSDFKGIDASNKQSADCMVVDIESKHGTSVVPMCTFTGQEDDLGSDDSEEGDEFGVCFKSLLDYSEQSSARSCKYWNSPNWNSRNLLDCRPECILFDLQREVSMGAQRAFGAHLRDVITSPDGILLMCSPALYDASCNEPCTGLACLREELQELLSTCFFGLRKAENLQAALIVEYAAPQDHFKLCYGFVKTGQCGRRNCKWWHEGTQQFVIRLQSDEGF